MNEMLRLLKTFNKFSKKYSFYDKLVFYGYMLVILNERMLF